MLATEPKTIEEIAQAIFDMEYMARSYQKQANDLRNELVCRMKTQDIAKVEFSDGYFVTKTKNAKRTLEDKEAAIQFLEKEGVLPLFQKTTTTIDLTLGKIKELSKAKEIGPKLKEELESFFVEGDQETVVDVISKELPHA